MISIIFPTYNEEDNLLELYKRVVAVVLNISDHKFEFIFVDDRSTDGTFGILKDLSRKDNRVKSIRFARNSGSHAAITAGLDFCTGDAAIVMAADIQDPPELIPRLIDKWSQDNKIVWGSRVKREGESNFTKLCSRMYYMMLNWFTSVKMPPIGADVFLADRIVIDALIKVPEKHTSVFMVLAWMGFDQAEIEYVKNARFAGKSKWTLTKKIKLALDSLLAFSDIPIRYMSVLGILVSSLGFVYAAYVLTLYFQGSPVEGWSSLIVAVLIVGGVQMMMLGVLGEYLWRTYDESRRRPRYIVEEIVEQ